jgi:hypothetical protein
VLHAPAQLLLLCMSEVLLTGLEGSNTAADAGCCCLLAPCWVPLAGYVNMHMKIQQSCCSGMHCQLGLLLLLLLVAERSKASMARVQLR